MGTQQRLFGRRRELVSVDDFLDSVRRGPAGLLLRGEAGIGKTGLWNTVVEAAGARGFIVLVARPVAAELALAYSGLGDLLDGVYAGLESALAPAQARALAVALRREDLAGEPYDEHALGRATLTALRTLATSSPLVVAIDDAQWLDEASANALAFAIRRLDTDRVGLVATHRVRSEEPYPVTFERASFLAGVRVIDLEPLSVGALYNLIRDRVSIEFSRSMLTRVHGASGGNPMYALELARALVVGDERAVTLSLRLPESLAAMVKTRVESLPPDVVGVLELIAVLGDADEHVVAAALDDGDAALVRAEEAGVISVTTGRVRSDHPLLTAAAYESLSEGRRRRLHRRAAALATDPEERARHLALSLDEADAEAAAEIEGAALLARQRGAASAAGQLAEHACRLTPPDCPEMLYQRKVALAEYLVAAHDGRRAAVLLDELLARPDCERVRLQAQVLRSVLDTEPDAALGRLDDALATTGIDPSLRVRALSMRAWFAGMWKGDLRAGEISAADAVTLAEQQGAPAPLVVALTTAGMIATLRGKNGGPVLERAVELEARRDRRVEDKRPRLALANARMWAGDLDGARALLEIEANELEPDEERVLLHRFLAELEIRAGNFGAARRHVADAEDAGAEGYWAAVVTALRGLIAAHTGGESEARAAIAVSAAHAESNHDVTLRLHSGWALGILELSRGDPQAAWAALGQLPEALDHWGVGEPNAYPILPDAIEALVALEKFDRAEALLRTLESQASALHHRWATPVARRCRGLLLMARGELDPALTAFDDAIVSLARHGYWFDHHRALLALGHARRRAGQQKLARQTLNEAQTGFDSLGCRLWAQLAARDLGRVSGRRATHPGDLTAAEERVAATIATGRTNKETAACLYTTVATVEAHLTRIYRKLNIRSRTELTRLVADGTLRLPTRS